MKRPTNNNADEWAAWFFEYAGHGASYLGVQIAEAMDEHVARTELLDRAQVPRIIRTDADHGVCVGGRFDGWLMWEHPDGQWVSVKKLLVEHLRAGGDEAKESEGLCTVPPGKNEPVSTQTACDEGESNDSATARRMPGSESTGSLASAIATTQCEDRASPGSSERNSTYGCKRAGGFVDTSCTAPCDCHVTQQLSRPSEPSPPADRREIVARPRVSDNDRDEVVVTLDGKELRGWSYTNDQERRTKMHRAREFVEGFYIGRETR